MGFLFVCLLLSNVIQAETLRIRANGRDEYNLHVYDKAGKAHFDDLI